MALKPVRLLYVVEDYDQTFPATNVGTFIRFCRSMGWQVTVLTTSSEANASVREFSLDVPMEAVPNQGAIPKYLRRHKDNFDVLFCYNGKRYNLWLPYLKLLHRKRYLIKTDGVRGLDFGSPRAIIRSLVTVVFPLRQADITLVESPRMAQSLGYAAARHRLLILPNSLNVTDYRLAEERCQHLRPKAVSRHPYVLYVGRLIRRKAVDDLLTAFATLSHAFPDWRLAIVGPQSDAVYAEELMLLAKNLGVTEKVVFAGDCYGDDLKAWQSHCDVFCLPSHHGEGMANVITEAMAFGKATVASTNGEAEYQLDGGRCGLLYPPGDRGALGANLHRLLSEPALRQTLGSSARERVESEFNEERRYAALTQRFRALGLA